MNKDNEECKLTIVVPTYNRAHILPITLPILLEQASNLDINVLIFNNASTDNTSEIIEKYAKSYKNLSIVTRKINIGADSNVLMCTEKINTSHVMIIGDDDKLRFNSLVKVLEDIRKFNPVWINYYSQSKDHPIRDKEIISNDAITFLKNVNSWNELLFISNNVFKTNVYEQGISTGLFYQQTQSAHLISALVGIEILSNTGTFIYSSTELFTDESIAHESTGNSYSLIPFLSFCSILPVLFNEEWKKEISRLIYNTSKSWLTMSNIFKIFTIHYHIKIKNSLSTPHLIINIISCFRYKSPFILLTILLAKTFGHLVYKYAKRRNSK